MYLLHYNHDQACKTPISNIFEILKLEILNSILVSMVITCLSPTVLARLKMISEIIKMDLMRLTEKPGSRTADQVIS